MFRILALHFAPVQDDRLKWRSKGTANSQVQDELEERTYDFDRDGT
jgi:hypothetical protein